MKSILIFFLAILSIIYLLNPTAGIFELIPDNIPFVGNVDEGLASYILFSSFEYFRGKQVGWFGQRKNKAANG